MRTGGEGYHASCVLTHLHYLFSCFCLIVSCFIFRNLTLPSFKKGEFVRNGYFAPMRSISVVMKYDFFTLNCFSENLRKIFCHFKPSQLKKIPFHKTLRRNT